MQNMFMVAALATTSMVTGTEASAQQMLPCEDYKTVMSTFEEQGTVFRGTTEGPNHRTVEVFEHVSTGSGIAIFHDRENARACAVSAGFDYERLASRSDIKPPAQ